MRIDIIVAIIAAIGYCLFIYYTRKSKTFEQYSVADRSIGLFLLFCSLSANFIGPGFTLGLTKQGFENGYFYLFVAGAYGIGKIIEGYFLAPRLKDKFKTALSIGDVVAGDESHNNRALHLIVGLISFCLVVGLSVVMSTAAGTVLNSFLGLPKFIGTTIITCIVTGYSVFGGLRSTMLTDTMQLIAFKILLPILAIIVIVSGDFEFHEFINNASVLTAKGFRQTSTVELTGMITTWMFGETLMPFTVNTVLAGKNSKVVRKALMYSGVLMIIWLFFMLTLGIMAKTVMPNIPIDDQVLLHLGKQYYIGGLFGLFTIAIVGVIMSSQDALINTASVIFTRDLLHVIRPQDESKLLKLSKVAGVFVGFLSIIFASFIPSIISGLLLFYSIWIPSVLVVIVFAIFIRRPSPYAAISAMVIGATSAIVWNLTALKDTFPNVFVGLFLSIVTYSSIHLLVKRQRDQKMQNG